MFGKNSIKTKLTIILLFMEVLVVAAFIIATYVMFQNNLRETALQTVKNTSGFYKSLVDSDIKMLSAALDTFTTNESFKELFFKGKIDDLLKASEGFFSNNRDRYGITHLYFMDNNGVAQLRVHHPEERGDKVARFSYETARKTQQMASAIEFSSLQRYALRVVKPYIYKGSHIGFVEMAEEIDHFNDIVKKETGIDVALLADKQFLDEKKYAEGIKRLGKSNNWNELENYINLGNTFERKVDFINKIFNDEEVSDINQPTFLGTINYHDRTLIKGAFPFYAYGNKRTALVYILSDATDQVRNFRLWLLYVLLGGMAVIAISFLIASHYMQSKIINPIISLTQHAENISLGKELDKKITTNRTDEIGMLTNAFERMRISLTKVMQMLTDAGKT